MLLILSRGQSSYYDYNHHHDDDHDDGDDADHYLFILPPHLVLHLAARIPQVVGLIRKRLALFDQNLNLLSSFDHFVHVPESLFLQFAQLFPETRQFVDFRFIIKLSHPLLQEGFKIFERMSYSGGSSLRVVSIEKGVLNFFEEVDGDSHFILG